MKESVNFTPAAPIGPHRSTVALSEIDLTKLKEPIPTDLNSTQATASQYLSDGVNSYSANEIQVLKMAHTVEQIANDTKVS